MASCKRGVQYLSRHHARKSKWIDTHSMVTLRSGLKMNTEIIGFLTDS